ncbi:MAG: phenylalanine--tRNA ligase subunit beta [Methanothrix sp.]
MPVVRLYYEDLEQMVGASRELILERLPMMGADVGKSLEADYIDVEFFPDRPDLYSAEGVARALQGFLNIKTGLPEYEVHRGSVEMYVDESVKSVRPVIGCAVVRGLRFTDPFIESLMSLQEDLHWGLGRNRRKVAIGVHDISRVRPPFRYIAEDPDRRTFVPLDFDESMSMREILVRHPKGVAYRHILDGFERFPLIVDADDNVLSFPPVINGELTRVREDTTDLFIDVTGTDPVVHRALNIVVTALAERGGRIEGVRMISPEKEWISPDLSPARWTVTASEANSLIGFNLSAEELAECLRRMRFGAHPLDSSRVEVLVPAYRADIMHTWDIIEDAAKSYGYENLKAEMPATLTIGRPHPMEELRDVVRDLMVGLGYLEVMPFTLTNEKVHFEMMRRRSVDGCTRVMHPISELHTIIRTDILPGLMEILSINQHHALPQRLFAVGDVVIGGRTRCHLSAVSIHSGAGFAEISSVVSAIMRELRISAEIAESSDGAFIPGRGADLMLDGARIGCFGEIHPEVISAFGLEHPVVGMELEISP